MDRLKNLNLKEVSAKTQIETDFLNALIEKDFERLSRFNVKGFLKILTREYDIDFTKFLEEYETFLHGDEAEETSEKEDKKITIATQIDAYQQTSSSLWIWFVVIIAIIGGLGYAIYQYDLLKMFIDKNPTQSSSSAVVDIIDEAQNNIKSVVVVNEEENKSTENTQTSPQEEDSNATDDVSIQNNTQTGETKTLQEQIAQHNESEEKNPQNTNNELSINANQEVIFSTNGKVWVGFIKLENGEKRAMVTENNFSADLSVNQLLLIGATEITLLDPQGQSQVFPAGNSKRFLIENGTIKAISLGEFMKYNKGKEW
ncbi:hypothetical protein DMB92_07015 [Campylobacter sp. MIT 99-7217]|uniref:hypothetical protein n=1 Tax=Campylobacter sp. MIT 99-7217 TaxID=535091 RepID=UPI0011593FA3|nr:hypothetical protein [Campylobacter sp. MIT 99-7217]TQR30965.1 hypothetical protein DMB92_07015 [Campylobacter sp. MIT 99-7217]